MYELYIYIGFGYCLQMRKSFRDLDFKLFWETEYPKESSISLSWTMLNHSVPISFSRDPCLSQGAVGSYLSTDLLLTNPSNCMIQKYVKSLFHISITFYCRHPLKNGGNTRLRKHYLLI